MNREEVIDVNETPDASDEVSNAPNAVIIHKIQSDDGSLNTAVEVIGDVRITEAETLMQLGLIGLRQRLGI
jgi:hypothetical protein